MWWFKRKMDYSSVFRPESMNLIYRVTDHGVRSAKECSLGIQQNCHNKRVYRYKAILFMSIAFIVCRA